MPQNKCALSIKDLGTNVIWTKTFLPVCFLNEECAAGSKMAAVCKINSKVQAHSNLSISTY